MVFTFVNLFLFVLLQHVESGSPAYDAGLRPTDLITHINSIPVSGLIHREIIELLLSDEHQVIIRAVPLENTTIKTDGKRRNPAQSKMARRRKRHRKKDPLERRRKSSILRRSSLKRGSGDHNSSLVCVAGSRSMTSLHRSASSGDSPVTSPRSPTLLKSQRSPPMFHSPPDVSGGSSALNSSQSSSPSSSCPNSPATGQYTSSRPSSLQGLAHKMPRVFRSSGHRRKSVGHIPLSPLARTSSSSSPIPTSPVRSPSPLTIVTNFGHSPGSSNVTQQYHQSHSLIGSPTLAAPMKKGKGKKFSLRSRNLETPPSPLLRRALSPEHEKASTDLFGSAPRSRADSGLDCVPIADIDEDILEKEPLEETEKTGKTEKAVEKSGKEKASKEKVAEKTGKEKVVEKSVKEKTLKEPKAKQKLKRSGNVLET